MALYKHGFDPDHIDSFTPAFLNGGMRIASCYNEYNGLNETPWQNRWALTNYSDHYDNSAPTEYKVNKLQINGLIEAVSAQRFPMKEMYGLLNPIPSMDWEREVVVSVCLYNLAPLEPDGSIGMVLAHVKDQENNEHTLTIGVCPNIAPMTNGGFQVTLGYYFKTACDENPPPNGCTCHREYHALKSLRTLAPVGNWTEYNTEGDQRNKKAILTLRAKREGNLFKIQCSQFDYFTSFDQLPEQYSDEVFMTLNLKELTSSFEIFARPCHYGYYTDSQEWATFINQWYSEKEPGLPDPTWPDEEYPPIDPDKPRFPHQVYPLNYRRRNSRYRGPTESKKEINDRFQVLHNLESLRVAYDDLESGLDEAIDQIMHGKDLDPIVEAKMGPI